MGVSPFLTGKEQIRPGITITSKKILQYAVILLGFGMNLSTVLQKGRQSLPIIAATITTSLVIAYVLFRKLKVPEKSAILIGIGSSICGGSAIAATAPVIDADDNEIAQAISVIFLFNIAAALLFPALGTALGRDLQKQYTGSSNNCEINPDTCHYPHHIVSGILPGEWREEELQRKTGIK